MKKWGLLVIEHVNMIDPALVQNRRNGVFNRPKLGADGAPTMAETHDGVLVTAFFGCDRRILSIHQHPRSQKKEVVMVAGANIKLRVYLVYHTLHRHSGQLKRRYQGTGNE